MIMVFTEEVNMVNNQAITANNDREDGIVLVVDAHTKIGVYTVPHPTIFGGCWFFNNCNMEKNQCAVGESGEAVSPPQWLLHSE